MNPFKMRPERTGDLFVDWEKFWVKPYNKNEVNPYTRTRIILMNGTEFENVWFSHQFSRSVGDDELRRKLAYIRKSEQQQQKILTHLKPADESALEHTIGYEQLAVDLTAHLAKRVNDKNIKSALDFALLEDFDHLYRYADYLDFTTGEHAEKLVGGYTEITPGRPTISHHRHPYDSIRYPMTDKCPATMDVLAANVITAAEQQSRNYYMNTAALWPDEMGRRLYQEIGMVEEQHVTQYGSLLKPCMSRLENLLVHQYVECWLYWSCYETETDTRIRGIWQFMFEQELKHLHIALELLRQYEKKDWQEVIPDAEFPAPLVLESNIEYVRCVLGSTVNDTACRERYVDVRTNAPETFDALWYEVETIGTHNRAYQIAHGCYSFQRKSFIRYMHDNEWSAWRNISDCIEVNNNKAYDANTLFDAGLYLCSIISILIQFILYFLIIFALRRIPLVKKVL